MNKELFDDAHKIIDYSINAVLPGTAVKKSLEKFKKPKGKTIMIAIGKAAYAMAKEALDIIDIDKGLVITKYNHSKGNLKNTYIIEAGHPILDENSIKAAEKAISMCKNLTIDDTVIMLISGGGSSLFESPLVTIDELQDINNKLLKSGASITEINTIRKRLSKVKGGKFAKICYPAKVFNIILSDIINDPLDMIASGPTYPDASCVKDALDITNKYQLELSDNVINLLKQETINSLDNIETHITGNNEELKLAAKEKAIELGYSVVYIKDALTQEVKNASKFMCDTIDKHLNDLKPTAIIMGGEVVVEVKGNGLGGRNQEFALRCLDYLKDKNACVFCLGSDGTDGPTDAAGAYVDKDIYSKDINKYLDNNDSYHYLNKHNALIKTGPTLTNVCDLYVALIK